MRGLALGVFVAGLSLGKAAHAQTSPYETPRYNAPEPSAAPTVAAGTAPTSTSSVAPQQQPNRRWYGGTILAMDAIAYAAMGAAFLDRNVGSFTAPIGVGMFLLSAPINHGGRYRWGAAGASFGLRVGLPLTAFALGGAAACSGDSCSPGPLIALTALGMLTASAIDAAALSYETLPPSLGVVPTLSVARGRVEVGAAGSF